MQNMFRKRIVILIIWSFWCNTTSFANLIVNSKIDVLLSPLTNEYTLEIPFKTTKHDVTISSISASCLCLYVSTDKLFYPKHSTGIITLKINTSGKLGIIKEFVILKTKSQDTEKTISIDVNLRIDDAIKISPRLLYCDLNKLNKCTISLNPKYSYRIDGVSMNKDLFDYKLVKDTESTNKYALFIQHRKNNVYSTHELVTIKVKMIDKTLRSYFMHIILQDK